MRFCNLVVIAAAACLAICPGLESSAAEPESKTKGDLPSFAPVDVFQLEFASDPQIAPDASQVAYLRNSVDIMTDKVRSQL